MRVVVHKQNVHLILTMKERAQIFGSGRWKREAFRGLDGAGRKTRTQVQRAVHKQMATKKYSFVSGNTRGIANQGALTYEIFAFKGGQRVEEYKGLRALKITGAAAARLNADRDALDKGSVRSGVWNVPRVFKRSFATEKGFFAMRPGKGGRASKLLWTYGHKPDQPRDAQGRFAPSTRTYGPIRRLFGPSLMKEIPKDQSLATFQRVAPMMMEQKIVPRLEKLMKF